MVLFYSHKITNRLKYISNLLLKDLIGVEVKHTSNRAEFDSWKGVKINYSFQYITEAINIYPVNILFESEIKQQNIKVEEYAGVKTFFATPNKSDLPFDIFAASFYLVSRYEEYLPFKKDAYGRFFASESLAYKHGFLNQPVVNIWAQFLKDKIISKNPAEGFALKKYKFITTLDIDSAFAFKQKGFFRTILGLSKSLSEFDFRDIVERFKVLLTLEKDPFDTFDYQIEIIKKFPINPVYFILFAEYGKYDKNIHVFNPTFRRLIKSISDYAEVGIHPSFDSNSNYKVLEKEIARLSSVLNKDVKKSRQHFLKLSFPTTYRNLLNAGIAEDYSMGYASQTGFRAGICDPFNFYDLDLEYETQLKVYPFAVMDGTLKDYLNLSALDVINYVKPIIESVKKVNGTYICLWHNESLSNKKRWIGWRTIFEEMIQEALP